MKVSRALISVFDKAGLVSFASRLGELGIEMLATSGTARTLQVEGIPVMEISEFTGFPEILGGRVRTLHPKVHAGLLYLREREQHVQEVLAHGIQPIDLVIVNLYPFAETASRRGITLEEALEQIDIGGPSMIRSAAKNYRYVTVVTDPADYASVLEDLETNAGETTCKLRKRLAAKAFSTTSSYDAGITKYLSQEQEAHNRFMLDLPLACCLSYGENPHQNAKLYGSFFDYVDKLHGRELSYNNILDISSAVALIVEFTEPTIAILKHTNPCGVGSDSDLKGAWMKAFSTDRLASFGGVVVINRPITLALAQAIAEVFIEVIIATGFETGALSLLQRRKNLRLMRILQRPPMDTWEAHSVAGGMLIQDMDPPNVGGLGHKVVSSRPPDPREIEAMSFGWKVVKHVKSNAIVYSARDCTLGIGAGQMSRIDASRIAAWKAQKAGLSLQGSAVCSDAFFPFADGLIAAAEAGATTAIQPGGAIRDKEVIEAADARGMAMVFTGTRHFKH
ncbi:Bifunctional purine biosynthesis protein PurH [Candidatus Xiphinematobacter sp. Idaho Grape]|uniref:bifunctional phosphoribosylaminoimidazolecarboxamide formyltransferase/IMP cyclohydrolase n=1 Tax=Candidatus Xiphinematobacter sp. Idaho Grape TaxID=1704307 RepID=UPI000705AB62|nr:bifunctional phosphoribosylaminoimidazolecarboxamide formyltransferase/IMP cyclohydrolase [Candidatus Xiphinematobacter sp. Idaho Grape]ALJ56329.1 Bifunctional purine biosynthesis protein PurH [Candidatus Xiphinematobacter sp. Idaho Grape]